MAKGKSVWFCSSCGSESAKWLGRCPDCGEWNTFVEEKVTKESKNTSTNRAIFDIKLSKPQSGTEFCTRGS